MGFLKTEHFIWRAILVIPSFYAWRWLYRNYRAMTKEYNNKKLFHERHNCVIMYSRNRVTGWPPEKNMRLISLKTEDFVEPFVYFIDTAEINIDMAAMSLSIPSLINALKRAAKRGVSVRIIINYSSMSGRTEQYRGLIKHGVQMGFFIEKNDLMNNIMHCKYMIKDCTKQDGYVCMGSLNFGGVSSILNNYEDVVFSTASHVLVQFSASFEKCWQIVRRQNKTPDNILTLSDANLL